MTARILSLCLFLFFALTLFSQTNKYGEKSKLEITVPQGPKPWTSLNLNNEPGNFQFAIVTDRTGGHRPGVFMEGVKRLNLLQPEFVMSVGDLIEGYTEDVAELDRQWKEFDGFIDQLEMPFFYLPGNHDITNKVMEDEWKKRFGPTYYHFKYKDVLFLCLNSEDQYRGSGRGTISDTQYDWIEKTLRENQDVKWTLVFMHQPLWLQRAENLKWPNVEKLLSNRQHTVFVGHRHNYVRYERNNGNYFMLATTGGSSSLRGPDFGEFDHVVWVTMTDDGPIIANLQLEGVFDQDVMTEEKRNHLNALTRNNPISVEPIFVDKKFKSGKARISLKNDTDWPMEVSLHKSFNWHYKSTLSENKVQVNPNSVKFVDLEIERRPKRQTSRSEQIPITAKVKFEVEEFPKVEIPYKILLGVEERLQLIKSKKAIQVDGDLSEWNNFPYQIKPKDRPNFSGQFAILQGKDHIYVAAKIQDDQLLVDPATSTWNQDHVGVVLNADPLTKSAMDNGRGWYRNSFYLTTTPKVKDLPYVTTGTNPLPEGTEWECIPKDVGYHFELAIPISYIKEKQGENWKTIRMNFLIRDKDEGSAVSPTYYWQPDWFRNNRIGSGMFFRK